MEVTRVPAPEADVVLRSQAAPAEPSKDLNSALNFDALERLEEAFELVDTDGNGLDFAEFTQAFTQVLGSSLGKRELRALFLKLDANSNGTVSWEELTEFMLLEHEGSQGLQVDETQVSIGERSYGSDGPSWGTAATRSHHKLALQRILRLKTERVNAYATCSHDGTVKLWETATVEAAHTRTLRVTEHGAKAQRRAKGQHPPWCTDIVFLERSHLLVVASSDRQLTFFDVVKQVSRHATVTATS